MTCKNCLHYGVCERKSWHIGEDKYMCDMNNVEKREICRYFKDKPKAEAKLKELNENG